MNDLSEINDYEQIFNQLRDLLNHKDRRISKLEEENRKLKRIISELEFSNKMALAEEKKLIENNITRHNLKKHTPQNKDLNTIDTSIDSFMFIKKENTKATPKVVPDKSNEEYSPFKPLPSPLIKVMTNNFNTINNTAPKDFYSSRVTNNFHKADDKSQTQSKLSDTSRNDIKSFLQEVKEKIPSKNFKEFIKIIKLLTDKNGLGEKRKEIFENVKNLFGNENRDFYMKFEQILSIKN